MSPQPQRGEEEANRADSSKAGEQKPPQQAQGKDQCHGPVARKFPGVPEEYELLEEVGRGGSATVWKARCKSNGQIVAIKDLDLEKCNDASLDKVHTEAQIMVLTHHPNLVHAYAFFTKGHDLWVVMPFCDIGSVQHVLKTHYPNGLEEHVISAILLQALLGLDYLHRNGHIHRDVKAGNILLCSDGVVRLADFGVSAVMFDHPALEKSTTFVGTPLWMAPEVLQQNGYNSKADIWSFGITALELAHGHAPFYNTPLQKVFLNTIRGPAPGLDKEHEKKFSKAFKDMVAQCLVKDPKKRPSAEKLLKHSFFRHAKGPDYLVKHLLKDLPGVEEREREHQKREQHLLASKQTSLNMKEQKSQEEYEQALGSWNFTEVDVERED